MTNIGRVGIVMKGGYNSELSYEALDAVSYNNGLYVAKQDVPAGTVPTNTTYWQMAVDESDVADKVGNNFSMDYQATAETLDSAINQLVGWITSYGSSQSGVMGWLWRGNEYFISIYAYMYDYGQKKLLIITFSMSTGQTADKRIISIS